jgi:catechol 2,3-dioxygenase-like lactoylglutathione lyase family enzyme
MFAKINHIAIISERYAVTGKFYEAVFGMKTAGQLRPTNAIVVGDGYVGLNINPRALTRPARLDHFGIEVEDVETAFERLRKYQRVEWLKRPSNRPFAGITTHDPDGNVFDLSQKDMSNRAGVYAETIGETNARRVDHFAIRSVHPDALAAFYHEMLELEKIPAVDGDPSHYLTDGHVTLVISPWNIGDYAGTSITAPCLDHIGFSVGDVGAFLEHVDKLASENRQIAPYPVGSGPEGRARLELAQRNCRLCTSYIADTDTVLLGLRP